MASRRLIEIIKNDDGFRAVMERVFETAVENAFDAIMITEASPGYPIIYVNRAFTDLCGYPPEEILGQSPSVLQGPNTSRSVLEALQADLAAGRPFHGEAVNYRRDGSEFIMEWKIAPIRDEDGQIAFYIAIQRDVTELRHYRQL
jgi:PAS domain S-box-containing protein